MQNPFFHQLPGQAHQGVSYDSSSLSSVTSTKSSLRPATAALVSAPPSRPSSALKMAHLLQPPPQQVPSGPLGIPSPYSHSFDSASGSSGERSSILPDGTPLNGSMLENTGLVPNAVAGGAGQPQQKRAYRQRRKDPSCDACRERKVKCDASESASCTECSNRKVRCQFTKETNRRMSSIKQVQDLEKQLNLTRQQLQQLRAAMARADLMDVDFDPTGQPVFKLPDVGYRPPRRARPPVGQDLSIVRANIRKFGKGIMKVPPPYRRQGPPTYLNSNAPPLPPKVDADPLIDQYYKCIHGILPFIHWPSFITEYKKIYQTGSLQGLSREWIAVLFGVFSCGALHTLERNRYARAKEYMGIAISTVDVWRDDFCLDQARVALLTSICLYEMNCKDASWIWLGSAVKIALDIGLHIESGPWPAIEAEMRKRVWWGIYAWDRLIALEMGKPMAINDQDCDVDLPCPVDEKFIQEGGRVPEEHQTTPLLATIHVVRSIGQLTKILKSRVISSGTLDIFERHFEACLETFPTEYHPKSNHYLNNPLLLAPILYLQNARFLLHRHNISPLCPGELRHAAINCCLDIALDTTRLLSRCMAPPASAPHSHSITCNSDWRTRLATSASTILCTHIWRCILLLLFREKYAAALICVQFSGAIGDARAVNTCSGRYVAFYLKQILVRYQRKESTGLDREEEMLAYASGDMQGTTDGSWVWQGSETGSQLDPVSPQPSNPSSLRENNPYRGTHPFSEQRDETWEGWEWVERTVQYLLNEQQQHSQRTQDEGTSSANLISADSSRPGLPMINPEPATGGARTNQRATQPNSRMTIANIIQVTDKSTGR